MKRIVNLIALFMALVMFLASCGSDGPNIYETLDKMVGEDYSSLTVEVTTENAFGTLESTYVIQYLGKKSTVTYTEESFAEFEIEDGTYVIPEKVKETQSGSYTVTQGQTVELRDGILLKGIGKPSLSFDGLHFQSVMTGDDSFYAEVINVRGFLGCSADAKNMTVCVSFPYNTLQTILVKYETAAGTFVTVNYKFK